MDGWDLVLLVVAAYLAVTALVRLMLAHRDKLLADFRAQMQREQQRQAAAPTPAPSRKQDRAA